jgi:hypothetical protein
MVRGREQVLARHALGDRALTAAGVSPRRWPPAATMVGRAQDS